MSSFKFVLNRAGVAELLKGQEMQELLQEKAQSIASACGAHYDHDAAVMGTRAIASVFTADDDGVRDNLDNNTILRKLR